MPSSGGTSHGDHDHVDDGSHTHRHSGLTAHAGQQRALLIAFAITFVVFVAEAVGGYVFGSLALAADAAHMFSDVVALGVAVVASRLALRPVSDEHSFGWRRVEVLSALTNGLLLLAVSAWIVFEAIGRLGDAPEVDAGPMVVVAVVGLLANLVSASLLHRSPGHSMNVRGAMLHTLSDAGGSLGAVVAGVVILTTGAQWVDAFASLFIAALVVVAAVRLLLEASHVLLEGTPKHLDLGEVERFIADHDGVLAVHHVHLWTLASDEVALSAHIELDGTISLHDAQAQAIVLKAALSDRFGVTHSTLELECHPCAPEDAVHL